MGKKTALGVVLFLAAVARSGTFFLGHAGGDQTFYAALAMKLDAVGFSGYTLREVGIRPDPEGRYSELDYETRPLFPLVELQKKEGLAFYDVPLFYTPPLFPIVLTASHALFAGDSAYRLEIKRPMAAGMEFHADEFYAALPAFLFGLATILVTAVLAWRHFGGPDAAIIAAALLAASPVDILASSRVWPDSTAAFFVASSLLLYLEAGARQSKAWSLAGGAALGLGILSKGTALCFLPSLVLMRAAAGWRRGGGRGVGQAMLDTSFFLYVAAAFVVTLPWHAAMTTVYGNPFYSGPFPHAGRGLDSMWYAFVRQRPWLVYPINTLFQNPAFLFWLYPLWRLVRREHLGEPELQAFFFPVALAALALIFWPGREERYLLPAYPALAVSAAHVLRFAGRALNQREKGTGSIVTFLAVGVSIVWSLGLAYMYLFIWQSDMVPVPF